MQASALLPILALSLFAGACDAVIVAQADGASDPPAVQAEADADLKAAALVADVKAAPAVKVEADVKVEVKPAELDLESIAFLIKKGKVKDAAALEKTINNPKEKLNNVDIDGDGKIDKIFIVEVKKGDGIIVFELHALPSKSKDKDQAVVLAYVDFTPNKTTNVLIVKATYAPCVIGYETIVYDYTVPIVVENDVVVVSGGVGFYGWLFAVHRPAFYGVVVYEFAPPPVIVIDVGYHEEGCWPPGHCKHGKWKAGGKHGKHGKHGKW